MSDTSIAPDLELCLARDPLLVRLAQELRYRVFYEEMGARANPATRAAALDADAFDDIADHLVVVDRSRSEADRPFVVGCYRLLRGQVAAAHGGFYSASEFDLGVLEDRRGEIVELGRSLVHHRVGGQDFLHSPSQARRADPAQHAGGTNARRGELHSLCRGHAFERT